MRCLGHPHLVHQEGVPNKEVTTTAGQTTKTSAKVTFQDVMKVGLSVMVVVEDQEATVTGQGTNQGLMDLDETDHSVTLTGVTVDVGTMMVSGETVDNLEDRESLKTGNHQADVLCVIQLKMNLRVKNSSNSRMKHQAVVIVVEDMEETDVLSTKTTPARCK